MFSYHRIWIRNPTFRNINYVIFARVNVSLLSSSIWYASLIFFYSCAYDNWMCIILSIFFYYNQLCMCMYFTKNINISVCTSFSSSKYKNLAHSCERIKISKYFLILFYNYFTTLAQSWANKVFSTILGTRVEVISWHWP